MAYYPQAHSHCAWYEAQEKGATLKVVKPQGESTVPRFSLHGNNWAWQAMTSRGTARRQREKPTFHGFTYGKKPGRKKR